MRNRTATIESLERQAVRPGTPHGGETARRLLEKMRMNTPLPFRLAFNAQLSQRGQRVFYNYWCYTNCAGTVTDIKGGKIINGQTTVRIRFDHLAQPIRVPVTSEKGFHLSSERLTNEQSETLSGHKWGSL